MVWTQVEELLTGCKKYILIEEITVINVMFLHTPVKQSFLNELKDLRNPKKFVQGRYKKRGIPRFRGTLSCL